MDQTIQGQRRNLENVTFYNVKYQIMHYFRNFFFAFFLWINPFGSYTPVASPLCFEAKLAAKSFCNLRFFLDSGFLIDTMFEPPFIFTFSQSSSVPPIAKLRIRLVILTLKGLDYQ